ncbi:MAG: DUF6345 domain-containing protein [Polyangiales bacterium]
MHRKHGIRIFALLALGACSVEGPGADPVRDGEDEAEPLAVEGDAVAVYADSSRRFSAYCDPNYEGGWQKTLEGTWALCDRFVGDLEQTSTRVGYWALAHMKSKFENACDHCSDSGVEHSDLIFHAGHGGAFSEADSRAVGASGTTATLTMWNRNQRALTRNMRLGDEARGLSIFSTYSCYTHSGSAASNDPNPAGTEYTTRWGAAFRGGLRIATGTVADAIAGSAYKDVGKRFSDNLQAGKTIASAWLNALTIGSDNDPSVIATGASSEDCWFRLDNMTWNNFHDYRRFMDGEVRHFCRRYWTDV